MTAATVETVLTFGLGSAGPDGAALPALQDALCSEQSLRQETAPQVHGDTQSARQVALEQGQPGPGAWCSRVEVASRPDASIGGAGRPQDVPALPIGAAPTLFSQLQPQITVKIEISQEKNQVIPPGCLQEGSQGEAAAQLEAMSSSKHRDTALVTVVHERQALDAMTSPRRGKEHNLARSEDSATTPSSIGPAGLEHKHVYLEVQNVGTGHDEAER